MRLKTREKNLLRLIMVFAMAFFCLSISTYCYAEELQIEEANYSDKYIEWLGLPEEQRADTAPPPMYVKNIEENIITTPVRVYSYTLGTSGRYNLRDELTNLKIKNQGKTEQCWAFSTTTQLESYMLKNKNKSIEFSPRHIEYTTSRTFLDGINQHGYYREVNSGGNFFQAYGYLVSGKGPVLESDMPFMDSTAKINLGDIQGKQVQAQLAEYKVFAPIYKEKNGSSITYTNGQTGDDRLVYTLDQVTNYRNEIKSHIMQYGAVGSMTSIKAHEFFSNPTNYLSSEAYYCDNGTIQADHAIVIVGWDDDYDVTNFNEEHRPTQNGAWIVQNSYGTQRVNNAGETIRIFKDGLLYISYEDALVERSIFGMLRVEDKEYDNLYQYDELGENAVLPIKSSKAYSANVFTKKLNTEYITQVGIYLNSSKDYTYNIYINNQDGTLDMQKLTKVKTISGTNSSYIAVHLDNPIKIEGSQFVVAVEYSMGGSVTDVPIEGKLTSRTDGWYTATSNAEESYVSTDGQTWYDMKSVSVTGVENINACIKAFTNTTLNITLYSDSYNVSDSAISKVSPNTNFETFKTRLISTGTIKLYNSNNQEVNNSQLVATGMTVKIPEKDASYKVIVRGDVNGDGKITATDLLKIKKNVVKLETLSGEFATAGDIDYSGSITSTDILQLKKAICNLLEL